MSDLISRSALMELARNHIGGTVDCNDIARFPGVDAVEVVRCKDCLNAMKVEKQLLRDLRFREDAVVCGMTGQVVLQENYCSGGVKEEVKSVVSARHCGSCIRGNKRFLSDGKLNTVCMTCLKDGRSRWEWFGMQGVKHHENT